MHQIPVRAMELEIPNIEEYDPKWAVNRIAVSYPTLCASLYVVHVERFLIKSMRRVIDKIEDPKLKEDVNRFIRQEAQHYKQHEKFNNVILNAGYPGLERRINRLSKDFERFLEKKSDKWCIGFVEGFESYTSLASVYALGSGLFDHWKTHKKFGNLFKWHLTEEIEHKNVAYDVYEHLYGDYLFRVRMCVTAQYHIINFIRDCIKIMSPVDVKRFDKSYHMGFIDRFSVLVMAQPMFFKTYMPWYSPHRLKVPAKIQKLTEEMSKSAESVS